jgi:hypothetical protein
MNRQLQKDLLFIADHITRSIGYENQGTFHKYDDKTGVYTFDKAGAEYARKALLRIAEALKS